MLTRLSQIEYNFDISLLTWNILWLSRSTLHKLTIIPTAIGSFHEMNLLQKPDLSEYRLLATLVIHIQSNEGLAFLASLLRNTRYLGPVLRSIQLIWEDSIPFAWTASDEHLIIDGLTSGMQVNELDVLQEALMWLENVDIEFVVLKSSIHRRRVIETSLKSTFNKLLRRKSISVIFSTHVQFSYGMMRRS